MRSINDIYRLIENCSNIVIGAGAGLSSADGLKYSGTRFTDNFSDFIEKYQLTDMYSSAFYPFKTLEERWGYFSRHIKLNRYDTEAGKVYLKLLSIVNNKNYFVITTNADALFEKAGFSTNRIFATQGDYSKFQCEAACHNTLYDNKERIVQMVKQQSECKIPSALIPLCPVCGKNLVAHLRIDNNFVENSNWYSAKKRYTDFIQNTGSEKLVLLELGVGFNTPTIIRFPFEQLAATRSETKLIRVNRGDTQLAIQEAKENAFIVNTPIESFIKNLLKNTMRIYQ